MGELGVSGELTISQEQQSMPLRESVFMTLRKAILTGKIKPGERLTEVKLGKLLGTSRTPIREAIRKLEQEGLVEIIPGSGARVARMTVEDLQDVMEIRRALEQLSAVLASQRITPEQTRELKLACDAFVRSIETGDRQKIADADVKFHDMILAAADNEKLLGILGGLADNFYRYRYEFIRNDGNYDQLIREHRDIYNAIIAHDEEKAREAARVHIEGQWRFIKARILEEDGDES